MNHTFSRRQFGRTALQLAALTLTLSGTQLAHAQNVSFAGKTIEWVIPFGVGGGSDVWARFNAPFLTKYLPGNPNVVVKNVPGGGSITGANQFAANAKPDGLSVLGTSGSTQFPYLLGDKRVKYNYKNWEVLMASPTGGVAYISTKLGVNSLQDLGKLKGGQQLVYGNQGATSLDLVPLLGFRMLGLEVKHVMGMKSRGEGRLAFERGEANIDYQTSSAYIKNSVPLVKEGKALPLFSWGVTDDKGNLIRDPAFPDLPHIAEAIKIVTGEAPAGAEWEAFKAFLIAGFPAQKMMLVPKETPKAIVEAYRKAFRDMAKDPEYKAGVVKTLGGYEQVTDAAAEALMREGTTIAPEARELVRNYLTKYFSTKF
ncbi:MAG: tripartite tricarboxylate transporter substrate-binding protein [Limnohabitans sp.]|nr:tripartite tricarboxylate transporter substrate-binding protein [Limnohabitans sp.]MDP4772331.1 tripartite tricarboxylate transporter substrate-binding protein [Limnohabitans sp.]MDP4922857.1 tripartite tricarboxylate transporter substrate-binding protein [Limnohabitans sp.]